MALGLRVPFTSEWLLGTALSGLVYLALLALFALGWWRAPSPATRLLYVVTASFGFVYALSPSTWIVDEPRYVVMLLPVLVLLVGQALTTVLRAAVAVVARVALSTLVLWQLTTSPEFERRADGLFVPASFAPLIEELERNGPRRVFAGYWVAYRLDFETDERLVAAEATLPTLSLRDGRVVPDRPTGLDESRHAEYDTVVRADPDAGFVLLREPPPDRPAEDARWRRLLEQAGYERTVVDGFAVYRRG
jgi:hypothetical protein